VPMLRGAESRANRRWTQREWPFWIDITGNGGGMAL
jgi:hypothetical protein